MAIEDNLPVVRYHTADSIYHYTSDNIPLTDLAARDDYLIDSIVAITSIDAAPLFIGQTAVVNRVGYVAVGTASPADWIQIT